MLLSVVVILVPLYYVISTLVYKLADSGDYVEVVINYAETLHQYIVQKIIFTKRNTSTETLMALFSVAAQMLILLLTGLLIIFGNIAVGTIASVGQISGNIFNSLSTINQLQVTIKSVDPILKKFHDFPEDPKTCIATIQDVRFENVSYHFGEKAIFEGFTQTFKKGGKYAITGCSGSGKSTLLNLLLFLFRKIL